MKRALLLGLLLLAPTASSADPDSGPGTGDDPAQRLLVERGAQDFQRYCASCHGVDGTGDGPVAASLRTPPADLTRIAARRGGKFPAAEIAGFIDGRFDVDAHGTREMPIWGRRLAEPIAEGTTGEEVARGRIQLLVEYLRTIQVAE